MPDQTELDTRIRALVARAIADAPAPPELERAGVPVADVRPDRRGWWFGGGATALAAAALVTAFVLVGGTDELVTTPATEPSTGPAPTTTWAPSTSRAPEPSTTATIPAPPAVTVADAVLTAGPDGVVEHHGGDTTTLTAEPMAMALDAGDGRVIVQRHSGAAQGRGWDDADTVPLVLAPDATMTNLFDTADWDGTVVLHDVEVVEGRRLLLFSIQGPSVPQEPNEVLYVVDLDTMERTEVAPDIGGWEFGTHRLHLASTGLIIGEAIGEANHAIFVDAVPDSPADDGPLPTAADLGLDEGYHDCTDCPHGFTVTPDGRTVLWIDGASGMLVARSLEPPSTETVPVVAVPVGFVIDVDVDDATVVLSFLGDPAPAPVLVPLDGSAPVTLEGVTATQPPLAPAPDPGGQPPESTPARPPATTIPPTTVPPTPASVQLATAGDGGITVIENGVEVRRLDQPATIALLTPGGAVIFQPAPTTPEEAAGEPLIWRPDGTVEPLLGPLGERQSYRLHDLASIAGIPTLLYGVVTEGTEPAGYTEVVHAVTMTPGDWTTAQITEVNTWEGGFDRLSLSNGGTIIGSGGEEVETWFVSHVVPGSPDSEHDLPSPASLGIEPRYSECDGCPNGFTISADGESIVWTEGPQLVVFDTASGATRAWTVPALADEAFRSLDVRTSSDGGVEVAISFPVAGRTAVVAATSPPGNVVETPVAGRVVTFGP